MRYANSLSGALALGLAFSFTVIAADGSGAVAQDRTPQIAAPAAAAEPELLPLDPAYAADPAPLESPAHPAVSAQSLAQLVAAQPAGDLPRELECLAGAIYFEAKSETLDGQLAVGRVIVNRARSGRFPASYCGVVFQRAQFSFVRGKAMPAVSHGSRAWRTAVAVARIAHEGSWQSAAEGALYFHAARVSPAWNLTRIARVDSHIFYR
ncbi:cell wall hydrolase [Novosphingobium piscinae]|uniref:Cell wall hydrolase n=1 Tax=Novosphingobium piscinae TaxID=1507448 RepID=A0A7X1KQT3_9SPHN|nr:cell wall hydrolase [Novosphingobium piscinae]MBC2670046.1 cell wall hydrolase [Novosphingobium piscinae]